MAEISSIYFTNGYQPDAAQLNDPARKGSADIAHMLQFFAMGDGVVPSAGIVIGGLYVNGKTGDMRVDVDAGAGAFYDAGAVAPLHPFGIVVLRDDTQSPALNDGDGTHPRIDVISITPSSGLLDSEPVAKKGGGSDTIPTRRGPDWTIVVTEGTPAASPVAPGTPSGSVKLAEVLVPAGLTASSPGAGGTNEATITDYRSHAIASTKGHESPNFGWTQRVDTWSSTAIMSRLEGVLAADGKNLILFGDLDENWPAFQRTGEPAGDETGHLYPLMNPGGRDYWIRVTASKAAGVAQFSGGGVEDTDWQQSADTELGFEHLTAVSAVVRFEIPIPIAVRGLEVIEFDVEYTIVDAFNSAGDLALLLQRWDRSAGVTDTIASVNPDTTIASKTVEGEPVGTPRVIETGDSLAVRGQITFEAVNDSAHIIIHSVGAKVREGRA